MAGAHCGPAPTTCLLDAMAWAPAAVRASVRAAPELRLPAYLFDALNGAALTLSSSCSGILTPELAARMGLTAIGDQNAAFAPATARAPTVTSLWACEWDSKAQEEILHQEPAHVPQH
eukprot:5682880-Alexandrium_andersonii.AAC.1